MSKSRDDSVTAPNLIKMPRIFATPQLGPVPGAIDISLPKTAN
jgi:hypothetical protein